MGGILAGIFTVTEASAISVVYAFIVAKFVYRELTWRKLLEAFLKAGINAATIMFIVTTAYGVAWLLNSAQVPQKIASSLRMLTSNPLMFLFLVNILLLIVGAVMDLTAALLILGPILLPIAVQFGLNPIHFGVVFVTNLAIGLVTPPVGSCLYLTVNFSGESVTKIIKASIPFLTVEILVLFLITYIEPIVMWLPRYLLR
ncbi:MAG: TRAP transporter large permease subunit [Spirochaetes bacterium]|nr:TRAP transporter large permease subunit [Spirochaetota bacterium]